MKTFLLFSISLIAFGGSIFCQCPPAGLKIQSPICDTPKNLRVNEIDCYTIKLMWNGNSKQQYIVEASGTDNNGNTIFEEKKAEYSCDESGHCHAVISVNEGALVKWDIQSICTINNVTIYSNKIDGSSALIPYCQPVATSMKTGEEKTISKIKVYPNPTSGYLTVEYFSKMTGNIEFQIFDMAGKMVFKEIDVLRSSTNRYQFDLKGFLPGTYLLDANTGEEVSRVKFVLIK